MDNCESCRKRKLWAYRTFLLHKWAVNLPKGPNTGKLFNLNFNTIVRWFVFKHFLGFAAGYWYKEAIKEGAKEYDSRKAREAARKTEVSRMRNGAS